MAKLLPFSRARRRRKSMSGARTSSWRTSQPSAKQRGAIAAANVFQALAPGKSVGPKMLESLGRKLLGATRKGA